MAVGQDTPLNESLQSLELGCGCTCEAFVNTVVFQIP